MFSVLLTSCCKETYLHTPPIRYRIPYQANEPRTVTIIHPDPLCHLHKGKRAEELLEDLLSHKILKKWVDYDEVEVPYERVHHQQVQKRMPPPVVVRCRVPVDFSPNWWWGSLSTYVK